MNKDLEMAKKIAKEVHKEGGKTYFVGGYVRDKILGLENKDIDIEVHHITPEQLKTILNRFGIIQEIGASFGILNLKGFDIDIAQPRMEKANGRGHKDFEVFVDPFIGEEKAAIRRDFTINALMEDVLTGEILDFFGGKEDLKNGVIRHINDDTFVEDPLRVLRAAQFASRFGFIVADETIQLSKTMDLSTLTRERIFGETEKALLKGKKPSVFFEVLKQMEQLNIWFPEVKALIGVEQSPIHHPEGDVWNHTMLVVDKAAELKEISKNPLELMFAALCHDFGKTVATTIEKDGRIRSIGHELDGLTIVDRFISRLTTEVRLKKIVLNHTRLHMRPHMLFKSRIKATNKLFDESLCPEDLLLVAKADRMGRTEIDMEVEINKETYLKERLSIFNDMMSQPQVTGQDLIKAGITPGPIFKEMLDKAHNLSLGGVSKENALKQVLGEYKKKEG